MRVSLVLCLVVAAWATTPGCDDSVCHRGESKCDGSRALTCGVHDGDPYWATEFCASAAHCKELAGSAKCVLDPAPSPACPAHGTADVCESETSRVFCVESWVVIRIPCTRCHDAAVCDGSPDAPCAKDEDCLPGLRCFDNRPISMYCRPT